MNTRAFSVLLTAALATSALSSIASAADLPAAPVAYTKAPMVSPATNWSGFYAGVNIGYGWGSNNTALTDATPPGDGTDILSQSLSGRSSGLVGGGQIGYNWQIGSLVTGLEADIQGSGIKGTATKSPIAINFSLSPGESFSASSEQKLSWFGTVRGRIGVTATPDLLLFATGGLAYGEVSHTGNAPEIDPGNIFDYPVATNQTKTGWAAGAGAEWMFARGWSAKVEYLHIDLGTDTAIGVATLNGNLNDRTTQRESYHWHNSFDTVRAGVNYHFN
jgi:outer membrane immunogenic protein